MKTKTMSKSNPEVMTNQRLYTRTITLLVMTMLWLQLVGGARGAIAESGWWKLPIQAIPGSQNSTREICDAHLNRIDRSLDTLRTNYRWREYDYQPPLELSLDAYFDNVKDGDKYLGSVAQEDYFERMSVSLNQLSEQLKKVQQFRNGWGAEDDSGEDQIYEFHLARGMVKQTRRYLRLFDLQVEKFKVSQSYLEDPDRVDLRPALRRSGAAVIVNPVLDVPTCQTMVPQSVGHLLLRFFMLNLEQKKQLTRRIIEDETTRVREIHVGREPGVLDPVFYVLVERKITLPNQLETVILMPFRQTIERINLDNTWNLVRLISDKNIDTKLVIRNSLVGEVPVTSDFSITGYNTCLSYQSATTEEHLGQTEIRFTPEMELTFYGKSSRRVRDVAYRGGVSSRCKAALNHVRTGTINRLESAITDLVFQENSTAKVAVDSVEPSPSEGTDSGISGQDPSLAEEQ